MAPRRADRRHVLVCGSRNLPSHPWRQHLRRAIRSFKPSTIVVHGGANGPDTWAAHEAKLRGLAVLSLGAPWAELGRSAGPIRNIWLLDLLPPKSCVMAFYDGKSRGTAQTIHEGRQRGFYVAVYGPDATLPPADRETAGRDDDGQGS